MENALQVMPSKPTLTPDSSTCKLNSWKEISFYIGCSVRTVQRYEEELGLPVHRFCRGRRSSPVFGFVDEIDLWLRSKPKQSLRYRSQPQSAQTIESELERAGAALEEAYAAYQQRLRHYIELKSASTQGTDIA